MKLVTKLSSLSTEILKLTMKPQRIIVDGEILNKTDVLENNSWTWKELENGGMLRIRHLNGNSIEIKK